MKFLGKLVVLQAVFLLVSATVFAEGPSLGVDTNLDSDLPTATEIGANDSDQELIPAGTVLPGTEKNMDECERIGRYINGHPVEARNVVVERGSLDVPGMFIVSINDILGCAIKTGDIKLWMIPYYIRYILELIIGLAGLVSVGGIVYGGYFYLFSGITEDKEQGKNAIKNAIIGIVLSLTAWAIVNIVISLVTG